MLELCKAFGCSLRTMVANGEKERLVAEVSIGSGKRGRGDEYGGAIGSEAQRRMDPFGSSDPNPRPNIVIKGEGRASSLKACACSKRGPLQRPLIRSGVDVGTRAGVVTISHLEIDTCDSRLLP